MAHGVVCAVSLFREEATPTSAALISVTGLPDAILEEPSAFLDHAQNTTGVQHTGYAVVEKALHIQFANSEQASQVDGEKIRFKGGLYSFELVPASKPETKEEFLLFHDLPPELTQERRMKDFLENTYADLTVDQISYEGLTYSVHVSLPAQVVIEDPPIFRKVPLRVELVKTSDMVGTKLHKLLSALDNYYPNLYKEVNPVDSVSFWIQKKDLIFLVARMLTRFQEATSETLPSTDCFHWSLSITPPINRTKIASFRAEIANFTGDPCAVMRDEGKTLALLRCELVTPCLSE